MLQRLPTFERYQQSVDKHCSLYVEENFFPENMSTFRTLLLQSRAIKERQHQQLDISASSLPDEHLRCFVKLYPATADRHKKSWFKTIQQRLRMSPAVSEGQAGVLCEGIGVLTPKVIAFGQLNHTFGYGVPLSLHGVSVVACEHIQGESLQEVLCGSYSEEQAIQAIMVLHKLHAAGYAHRDANLINFHVSQNQQLYLLDLERLKPATKRYIQDDLVKLLKGLAAAGAESNQLLLVCQAYQELQQLPWLTTVEMTRMIALSQQKADAYRHNIIQQGYKV